MARQQLSLTIFFTIHSLSTSSAWCALCRYGFHACYQSYFLCNSPPTIAKIFGDMRNDGKYPTEIRGEKVVRVRDLTTG